MHNYANVKLMSEKINIAIEPPAEIAAPPVTIEAVKHEAPNFPEVDSKISKIEGYMGAVALAPVVLRTKFNNARKEKAGASGSGNNASHSSVVNSVVNIKRSLTSTPGQRLPAHSATRPRDGWPVTLKEGSTRGVLRVPFDRKKPFATPTADREAPAVLSRTTPKLKPLAYGTRLSPKPPTKPGAVLSTPTINYAAAGHRPPRPVKFVGADKHSRLAIDETGNKMDAQEGNGDEQRSVASWLKPAHILALRKQAEKIIGYSQRAGNDYNKLVLNVYQEQLRDYFGCTQEDLDTGKIPYAIQDQVGDMLEMPLAELEGLVASHDKTQVKSPGGRRRHK